MLNHVYCLMGPTASGKTAVACELIKRLPFEIVSVDSAMIYRGMNIGTAKPDLSTLAKAPHHLIDLCNPDESYSAAQFCYDASACCNAIIARGNMPLLVGGTMMYFRAFQQGLSKLPVADANIRAQLLQEAQLHGWEFMHAKLMQLDPMTATRIHAHDTQRIQRALEVYVITGKSLSECFQQGTQTPVFKFINFMLQPMDRKWLHARIAQRFKSMLDDGFLDEMRILLQNWPQLTLSHTSMRCVGYRQAYEHLSNAYNEQDMCEKGIAATRQLAKRQLTWLRNWSPGHVLEAEKIDCVENILGILTGYMQKHVCSLLK